MCNKALSCKLPLAFTSALYFIIASNAELGNAHFFTSFEIIISNILLKNVNIAKIYNFTID